MNRYNQYLQQEGKFSGTHTAWPPFRLPGARLPTYWRLPNLLHCKTMHALIFTILYKAVHEPNVSEPIIYLCIFLLEMAVKTTCIVVQEQITVAHKVPDLRYDAWFPSNSIFTNIQHTIRGVSTHKEINYDVASAMPPSAADDDSDNSLEEVCGSPNLRPDGPLAGPSVPMEMDHLRSSTPPVEETVEVNESILSLLIKLHSKLSEKKCSYVPRSQQHAKSSMGGTEESRIGDGPHFVGQLLNKIAALSMTCAKSIEDICEQMKPKTAAGSMSDMDKEERKKKVRERQKKLMEEFAGKQKKFLEQTMEYEEATEASKENEQMEGQADEEEGGVQEYDCVICGQTTASTEERPVGMVTLLQATSVLGHRTHCITGDGRTLPLDEKPCFFHNNDCGTAMDIRLASLQRHFDDKSCLLSMNIGWEGGVFVQTCGHHLHLDCLCSYIESLKNEHVHEAHRSFEPDKGEYLCPLCRQLANGVLPCRPLPREENFSVVPGYTDMHKLAKDVMDLLQRDNQQPNPSSELYKSMTTMMQDLTNATYPKYRNYSKVPCNESIFLFLSSIARTNLELELLQKGGSMCNRNLALPPLSAPTRKMCTGALMRVLGLHAKVMQPNHFILLWSSVTRIPASEDITSVALAEQPLPLLLQDPTTLLIHLVLMLPLGINKAYYTCIVRSLYNVQVVQALAILSCDLTDSEREAWRQKTSSHNPVEQALGEVISHLIYSCLYEASDETVETSVTLTHAIWTEQSVESSTRVMILPYLRTAAMLLCHLYGDELPGVKNAEEEFVCLAVYLGLCTQSSVDVDVSCMSMMQWTYNKPPYTIRNWCHQFNSFVNKNPSAGKSLMLRRFAWCLPALLRLPNEYDKIFTYYRTKQCYKCSSVPKEPAVCLICGMFVCMRDKCCKQQSAMECVQHSVDCGAGTGVFLAINSSLVIVISGARAGIWGSVYLDSFGEEDRDLRRGKPLYLSDVRYRLLEQQWINHSFDRTVKKWIWHRDNL
ncbi:PREDICTED: E3 ubiquitin-protein ligase UBR3-like isoform X2 [Priapulus caudatus]|uniref:E3 ubiquitin-protein ligase n=1 Tax=Priapulus caudatus TaxID=37621 RepID=A0ABM1E9U4_PRICU|nr:PREDICTED: E3 ubiquitin-protein ligase UBR3-like isoform X2 [Priapulus caudatus]